VVLNLDTLADRSTYTAPHRYPDGVEVVIVNGAVVVHNQDHAQLSAGVVVAGEN
jgi:hypothetical protein